MIRRAIRFMCGDGEEHDRLIRYHFGDLDPSEAADVEARLAADPEYADRLHKLVECLTGEGGSPACAQVDEAPRDLADRTAHSILAHRSRPQDPPVNRPRCTMMEVAAVGFVAVLLGAISLPAVQSAREAARRHQCAGQLREISRGLNHYATRHRGAFPEIGPFDNAGMFTVALADSRSMNRDFLQRQLVCPSSQLASQVAAGSVSIVVPTRAEMHLASPLVLDRLRRVMAGDYAYALGYLEDRTYVWPRSNRDSRTPILADAPARRLDTTVVSNNHGSCGQNVLFDDGHVEFLVHCWSPGSNNHLYLNDQQEVAAGRGPTDCVLAPSEATPGVLHVVRFRYR